MNLKCQLFSYTFIKKRGFDLLDIWLYHDYVTIWNNSEIGEKFCIYHKSTHLDKCFLQHRKPMFYIRIEWSSRRSIQVRRILGKPLISQNFAITNGNWVTYFNIFLYWLWVTAQSLVNIPHQSVYNLYVHFPYIHTI